MQAREEKGQIYAHNQKHREEIQHVTGNTSQNKPEGRGSNSWSIHPVLQQLSLNTSPYLEMSIVQSSPVIFKHY